MKYLTRSWWCSAAVASESEAQRSLDHFCVQVAGQRRRGGSTIAKLVAAERLRGCLRCRSRWICVKREMSRSALVAFQGNRYSVPATLAGAHVTVRARLGEQTLQLLSAAGTRVASHRRAPRAPGS